ncbi:MAG: flagellar hook-basal body complex protein [Candidatus Thiodiazotropha sp. (ex Dulcina madagascariensis)]|nr:flagellar hook-basal body complex protein [Candidatus Thiodiazotropha sp. (ex Dulcina madagascariensis)]
MLGSVYIGLTGLLSFSKGLDVISNNVANMNTPGFKKSDLLFQNLMFKPTLGGGQANTHSLYTGQGVSANQSTTNFSQGELRDTNNNNVAAIDGTGFFIVRNDSDTYFTRYGGFEIDDDGFLVSTTNNGRIAALSDDQLIDINIEGDKRLVFVATTRISFKNNLSTGGTEHTIEDIEVFDSEGNSHKLSVHFLKNSAEHPRSWQITVKNEAKEDIGFGQIRFAADGSPEAEYNTVNIELPVPEASPSNIELYFGEPGSFIDSTSFSEGENSNLAVNAVNGSGSGSLIKTEFDSDGKLIFHYSNGEKKDGPQLGLAWFDDLQALTQIGDGLFMRNQEQSPIIGTAGSGIFGNIIGGKIELSNVELTLEFSDLIIIQRGYQASSQILTTSNEIMQQTLDMGSSRR